MMQLLGMKKRLKSIKQMPELVAVKHQKLAEKDYYNKMVEYDRIRNYVDSKIPPNQANKEMRAKVISKLI